MGTTRQVSRQKPHGLGVDRLLGLMCPDGFVGVQHQALAAIAGFEVMRGVGRQDQRSAWAQMGRVASQVQLQCALAPHEGLKVRVRVRVAAGCAAVSAHRECVGMGHGEKA